MALDHEVNEILGHKQTPMLVMTDSREEGSRSPPTSGPSKTSLEVTIDFIVTLTELIPEAQEEKRAIIERLGKTARAMSSPEFPVSSAVGSKSCAK